MAASSKLHLHIKNIGPHVNLKYSSEIKKLKMAIYARNGEGKTFISRAFRAMEIDNSLKTEYAKNLLRNDANEGYFLFQIDNSKYELSLNKTGMKIQQSGDKKIFHTFNSDYIRDNFVKVNYNLNENIPGYILGKENIDLSDEKLKLTQLTNDGIKLRQEIEEDLINTKKQLTTLGISKNQKSYKSITYDSLKDYVYSSEDNFEKEKERLIQFNNLPEDIETIPLLRFSLVIFDQFTKIQELLKTEYSLQKYEESFRKEMIHKNEFIQKGLDLYQKNKRICPFCKQEITVDAEKVISEYISFVNDQESKIIHQIDEFLKKSNTDIETIKSIESQMQLNCLRIERYSQFFESLDQNAVDDLKNILNELCDWIEQLKQLLMKKRDNIRNSYWIDAFKQQEIFEKVEKINDSISKFNKSKDDTTKTKKGLKESVCNSAMNKLRIENNARFMQIKKITDEYGKIKKEIDEKEYKNQKSKKKLVATDLKKYLDLFFYGKYNLNEDTFCLSLYDKQLESNPDSVLSDGEKTIISFCYYLANIHTIIQSEQDYENIILIIDDPISSMDVDYIYQLVSIIKNYADDNKLIKFEKYIILTHNLDFYNMLFRTNTITYSLCLKRGEITNYPENLIMPYEFHLIDVYSVAKRIKEPSYTTGNSIRHILETICQFEGYDKKTLSIDSIIKNNEEFKNDIHVLTYMQDLSHGAMRYEVIQNDEMIIKVCEALINFVKKKYPKQIENCVNNLGN